MPPLAAVYLIADPAAALPGAASISPRVRGIRNHALNDEPQRGFSIKLLGGEAMAYKKEWLAMLLAGGQGSRLYALTQNLAKPAVPYGGKYRIIADRIVGATYLCAAACCGGEVRLRGVDPRPLSTVSGALSEAGCTVKSGEDDVFLQSDGSLRSIRPVRTAPYPGFPTDAQPVLMAALLKSAGSTVFVENIFENRYRHVDELARMGAEVRVAGRVAVVTGREHLHGARVKCTDLRAGAALVIAGLQADGLTRISRIEHIDRGYESIERDLGVLGAHVRRETGT